MERSDASYSQACNMQRHIIIIFFQNESTPKVGPETAVKIEGGPKRPIGRPALALKRAAK